MENETRPGTQARRRLRRAAEQLLEDSSLRSHLTDMQAQQLLDWGLAYLQQTAHTTANLSDEAAMPLLEEKATAVRGVMQLVNRVVGSLSGESPEALDDHKVHEPVIRLFKNLSRLTGQLPDLALVRQAAQFQRRRPQLNPDDAFQLLMDLIRAQAKVEEEE